MIRFINCVKRRPDITVEQFRKYWNSNEFEELIKQVAAVSGVKRYRKSATLIVEANALVQERRGSGAPFDGVLEYWWDNASHLTDLFGEPNVSALTDKMLAYQKQFIDMPHTSAFFTEAD